MKVWNQFSTICTANQNEKSEIKALNQRRKTESVTKKLNYVGDSTMITSERNALSSHAVKFL